MGIFTTGKESQNVYSTIHRAVLTGTTPFPTLQSSAVFRPGTSQHGEAA